MIIRTNIQGIKKRAAMMLMSFLLLSPVVFSQLTVGIDNQYQCQKPGILIPVRVSDFNDVSAITLHIEMDASGLVYDGLVHPNELLQGGVLMDSFSISNGKILLVITWQGFIPVSITSGTLFDLKIDFTNGSPNISFTDDCEIALSDLSVVENAIFNDGSIQSLQITNQPQNQTVIENTAASFSITQLGASSYQWQKNSGESWENLTDTDGISGSASTELIIDHVPLDSDQTYYRCVVSLNDCSLVSDSAVLTVKAVGIETVSDQSSVISVYPNPCDDKLNIVINTSTKNACLQLIHITGKVVIQIPIEMNNASGLQSINTGQLASGLYFLQLRSENKLFEVVKVVKQ
ncbi:MAG: T9SS type A sorting domain-containing protein [Bacteroidales bacterium]